LNKSFLKDERGNISFVFVFAIIAIMIIFMFVFLAPALTQYTTKVYLSAEPILNDANTISDGIVDLAVQDSIKTSLQNSKNTTLTQIEVLGFFYQYAWLFVISISALILLLFSRFLVERQTGGAF